MRGGDGKAGFAVRDPNGAFVMPYTWKESAEHEEQTIVNGGKLTRHSLLELDNSLLSFSQVFTSSALITHYQGLPRSWLVFIWPHLNAPNGKAMSTS